jgi:hypothetical protein
MSYIIEQTNKRLYPYSINKELLKTIINDLIEQIILCYQYELGGTEMTSQKMSQLSHIVHTHCYNSTYTTKKALKLTLHKYLSETEYSKFGLKLLYIILDIGTQITHDKPLRLERELKNL